MNDNKKFKNKIIKINKSIASGCVSAPPSKSYAHRMLIASLLSNENCVVKNVSMSNDIIASINCIKALGKDVVISKDCIYVNNGNNVLNDELVFDCLESGSTLRFFIPIACLTGKKLIFKGSKRLIERGIGVYEEIFKKQNISLIKEEDRYIIEGKLQSDDFYVSANISSQFISGLLFALPLLDGDSKIIITSDMESKNYIDVTIDVLRQAGINIEYKDNVFYIKGNQKYKSLEYVVEGDWSNSAFLEAFNYFGSNVIVDGLNDRSCQGDKVYREYFDILNKGYACIDIKNCIDLGPVLFCFSALKYGAKFINTARLKIKESDRVKDLASELAKFNVLVIDNGNEVIIDNKGLKEADCLLSGKNDHRIVMALSLMLSVFGGELEGYEAVNKSYPNFFEDLKKLGLEVEYVR